MKRFYLLMSSCLLAACTGQAAQDDSDPADQAAGATASNALNQASPSEEASDSRELVPASFFVDPANNYVDIPSIRENTDATATINGHYSQSVVSCGTACVSFWIIDRNTGAIIDVPGGSDDTEMIDWVQGRLDSDVITVIYGSRIDSSAPCRSQDFRLSGNAFSMVGESSPSPCSH